MGVYFFDVFADDLGKVFLVPAFDRITENAQHIFGAYVRIFSLVDGDDTACAGILFSGGQPNGSHPAGRIDAEHGGGASGVGKTIPDASGPRKILTQDQKS